MNHTPEPWVVNDEKCDGVSHFEILNAKRGNVIADTYNSEVAEIHEEFDEGSRIQWDEQGKVDMQRAADCVNACAGKTVAEIKRAIECHDVLVAALKEFFRANSLHEYEFDSNEPTLYAQIEAAIAQAEKETP